MGKSQPRDRRPLLAGVASAVAVVLFFGWFITFGPGRAVDGEPSAIEALATRGASRTASAPAIVGSVAPEVTAQSVAVAGTAAMTQTEARAALERLARANSTTLEIRGQWVAQLASKYEGIVDPQQVTASGTHTFEAADIYAEHLALQGRVTGAEVFLVDSRTFGAGRTVRSAPLWVTIATNDTTFTSADAIVAWCARQFPDLSGTALNNSCLATRLDPLDS